MEIHQQVALVTGGGSGLGAATARLLSQQGAKVVVLDQREASAKEVAEEIKGFAFAGDVSDGPRMETLFKEIVDRVGIPRVAVSCAGICPAARVVSKNGPMDLNAFQQVIQVNLVGTFNVMRLAAYWMSQSSPMNPDGERGVIINTASIAAEEGQIGQAAYSASKAGVLGLTLPSARELARFGIRVMSIAPGIMETPMVAGMPQALQESFKTQIPFPSRFAKPMEFAMLVQQIIENPMLNGSVIRLDGAMRMQEK